MTNVSGLLYYNFEGAIHIGHYKKEHLQHLYTVHQTKAVRVYYSHAVSSDGLKVKSTGSHLIDSAEKI